MGTRSRQPPRILWILGALLIAAPVAADEAAPTLHPGALELLPINDLERKELSRDHPDIAARVHHLRNRLKKLHRHLAGRTNRDDDGSRKLRQQIRQTQADMAPLLTRVVTICREHELSDALIEQMNAAPQGPHRVARYAQSLVLFVLAEDASARALFERVVPATTGAILALESTKADLRKTLEQTDADAKDIRLAVSGIDRRIRAIEKRFWRLVDYVLPEADRAAIHRVLPTAYQKQEDVLSHLYALPDLSASQAVRLRSVLVEFEAETAPDTALTRRLQQELRNKDLDSVARGRIHKEMRAAGNRVTELHRAATNAAKTILSESQWTELEAIPPRVSLGDRKQTSPQVLAGVEGYERDRLAAMRKELEGVRREYREKRQAAAALGKDYGPDSPQMGTMQMAMANVEAEANVLQRRFNGRLFTELLTIDQVVLWVINPR